MRELLKEARDALRAVQHYIPPADETVEMTPAITADVGACQEIADRIDAALSAPKPDALEVVRNIRLGGYALNANDPDDRGPNGDDYHFTLTDTEAAALIQPTVPRAMLEVVWDAGNEWNGSEDPMRARREDIEDIAAKYGVKVGG